MSWTTKGLLSLAMMGLLATPGIAQEGLASSRDGQKAITEAAESVDTLIDSLRRAQEQAQTTLKVLQDSMEHVKRAGREKEATEISALILATQGLKDQLAARAEALTRILDRGAGKAEDPVGTLQARIAEALAVSDYRKMEDRLLGLKRELAESETLEPYLGLLHFHIGETQRKRANLLTTSANRSAGEASRLLKKAAENYEAAADPKLPDLRDVAGTSLKASALCRCVQVQAALYIAYAEMPDHDRTAQKKAGKYLAETLKNFQRLKDNHAQDTLDGQVNVVDEVRQDVRRMEEYSRR